MDSRREHVQAQAIPVCRAAVIVIAGVVHRYAGREVLRVASFEAMQGEAWLLLGPSGCGKTTLLHILAGLLCPEEGEVSVAGERLDHLSAAALDKHRGRRIGIIPQKPHLIASLSVVDNLRLAQSLAGLPEDAVRVTEALAGVGLSERSTSRPRQLSHGEAQRVAVARALVNRPRVLLADEPTANLDDANCIATLDLLQAQARAGGATLVIATHDARVRERFPNQLRLTA